MGAVLDFLSAAIASASARSEDLGWEGTLIVLFLIGLCALAVFGISKLADAAERKPRTFSSWAVLFAARAVRAVIIFVVVYTVTAGVFGPRLPVILLLALLGLTTALVMARKRGWDLSIRRSWHWH